MSLDSLIAVCGLAFDISGAIILALALILKNNEQIENESTAFCGGNPFIIKASEEARLDGRIGVVFLVTGFILQATPYYRIQFLQDVKLCSLWQVLPLVFIIVAFLIRALVKFLVLSRK